MGLLSPILRNGEGGRLIWWCPGCNGAHQISTGQGAGPRWAWNGNPDRPTFTPSVLVTWTEPKNLHDHDAMQRDITEAQRRRKAGEQNVKVPQTDKVCHSFVVDGQMQMLGDCTHPLAGQIVAIPPWPASEEE